MFLQWFLYVRQKFLKFAHKKFSEILDTKGGNQNFKFGVGEEKGGRDSNFSKIKGGGNQTVPYCAWNWSEFLFHLKIAMKCSSSTLWLIRWLFNMTIAMSSESLVATKVQLGYWHGLSDIFAYCRNFNNSFIPMHVKQWGFWAFWVKSWN